MLEERNQFHRRLLARSLNDFDPLGGEDIEESTIVGWHQLREKIDVHGERFIGQRLGFPDFHAQLFRVLEDRRGNDAERAGIGNRSDEWCQCKVHHGPADDRVFYP